MTNNIYIWDIKAMICNWLYSDTSVQCFMLKRKIKHDAICSGLLCIVLRKIYFKTEYKKSYNKVHYELQNMPHVLYNLIFAPEKQPLTAHLVD